MKVSSSLPLLLVVCFLSFLSAVLGQSVVPAAIAFPGGTAIQGRARWGRNGFEAALYIGGTVGPSLNPAGTPAWIIGTSYPIQYTFSSASGVQTLSIDFDGNSAFDPSETITQVTAFVDQGFRYFSIFMSGSSTSFIQLANFVVNGVSLGTFNSPGAGGNIDLNWENLPAGFFSTITATGTITFTGLPGTSDEIPRVWFRTAVPVNIPLGGYE